MKRHLLTALCLVLAISCLHLPVYAQVGQSSQPRLVLLLVVDQFSYDYLSRYQDKFGAGGFRFLMDHGANFVNCRFKQATNLTSVGHSVIATGAYPWATGVIANNWYDRRKDKELSLTYDESVQLIGSNGQGASSKMAAGTTIGDEMKLATNGRSKVITIALKDRASLFLSGRLSNNALWWDTRSGNFVSSSQFGTALPNWVKNFNDQHYADRFFGKPWNRLLPENLYTASTRDDYTYEAVIPGDGRQFPHVITGGAGSPGEQFYTAFQMTPFANQMIGDLAREAIQYENLGTHTDPDLLAVSFSASDFLGHAFGPYSQEVEDLMLRLDQTITSLLQSVDQKIGLNKCVVVLTGDHGVMPIPEFLKERGLDAGRIDPKAFKNLLDSAMDSRLGADDWISSFLPPNLYLNLNAIDKQKYRQPEVESLAAKLARSISGVGDVYTAFQFFNNQLPSGPATEAVRRAYYWGRSGELYVLPKPGFVFHDGPNGTTHGAHYSYDSQVPLIIFGTTVRGGKYAQDSSPADIAPTLAAILNINAPSLCEGRALNEALAPLQGPARPMGLAGAAPVGAQPQ